jgi:23S rRNA (guanine745-N1)-methyltransferase
VLACPVCGLPLAREARRFACARGHAFDVAREGYVNLLPAGRRDAGDAPEMLRARRAFLERGHYAPLADALASRTRGPVLDAGCGEGWYLRRLDAPVRAGIDLSRAAVRLAAQRDPAGTYAVAEVHRLPVLEASVGTLLSVFSHRSFAEFARVLRPGGRLLLVEPGTDHLRELRELLADDPRMRRERTERPQATGPLRVEDVERLRFRLDLDRAALAELLAMTPFALHAAAERRERALARGALAVTVDFAVTTLVRDGADREKPASVAAGGPFRSAGG